MDKVDFIKEYNTQRGRNASTIQDVISDLVEDAIMYVEDRLDELVDDVNSGNFSNSEIAERLEEIRDRLR